METDGNGKVERTSDINYRDGVRIRKKNCKEIGRVVSQR